MKHALVLAKAYFPHLGGVETIARTLAEGLCTEGVKSTVLCFGEGPEEESIHGVRVRRIRPVLSVGSAPLSPEYSRLFKELAPTADILHIHSPNPAGELAWLLAPEELRRALPSLCTYQGDPVRPRLLAPSYLAILRAFLARCSCIAASSPPLLRSSKALRHVQDHCTVIPLGIKTERFTHRTKTNEFASRIRKPFGLFVGRMVYYKGLEILLRAIRSLPDISLLLVGNGPLRPDLERMARSLGISKRVHFAPPVDETAYPSIFQGADFFVLPSVSPSEAFGLSMVEAMASGLPVISTELGTGTSYVNLHGETGLVVPPGDPEALGEAIQKLCAIPNLAARMGKNAEFRATRLFDEHEMLRSYSKVYAELLTNRRPLHPVGFDAPAKEPLNENPYSNPKR